MEPLGPKNQPDPDLQPPLFSEPTPTPPAGPDPEVIGRLAQENQQALQEEREAEEPDNYWDI